MAAGLVFVYHVSYEQIFSDKDFGSSFADVSSKAAWIGVSFFFVLSGFVLTWSARPGDRVGRFWRRRVAKIYPNHAVTWLVTLFLISWAGMSVSGSTATLNLFLVHTWVPKVSVFGSVNPVSWSLACEVLFYLAFPVLLPLVTRIRPERLWAWAGGLVAVVFLMPVVAQILPEEPLMPAGDKVPAPEFWFVYGFPPVRGLEFVLGMIMARIVLSGRWIRLGVGPALALVVAGYVAAREVPVLYSLVAATIIPLALIIPAVAAADVRGARSPLRTRPMVLLGEISYAFYLVHYLVVHYGHLWFGRARMPGIPVPLPTRTWDVLPGIGMIGVFLLVSVVLSWLLYQLVERPVMRRWSRPRRREPAPAVLPQVPEQQRAG